MSFFWQLEIGRFHEYFGDYSPNIISRGIKQMYAKTKAVFHKREGEAGKHKGGRLPLITFDVFKENTEQTKYWFGWLYANATITSNPARSTKPIAAVYVRKSELDDMRRFLEFIRLDGSISTAQRDLHVIRSVPLAEIAIQHGLDASRTARTATPENASSPAFWRGYLASNARAGHDGENWYIDVQGGKELLQQLVDFATMHGADPAQIYPFTKGEVSFQNKAAEVLYSVLVPEEVLKSPDKLYSQKLHNDVMDAYDAVKSLHQ